jgi:hypothetical protein
MTINNNNIFGAFTLGEVRSGRLTGDWLNKETVSNYGWFIGGKLNTLPDVLFSTIDRIDFSNDSVSASVRGSLLSGRFRTAATGNSNYGWIGGGKDVVSEGLTTVDRIDYSNESSNTSNRGPLSSARGYLAATGNSNYGWFGGGLPSLTTVDRIDYSNDSSIASSRGPLNTPRGFLFGASGNSNYGWFGGGGDTGVSSVDRIDYSNDSSIASSRGPLTREQYGLNATGNSNYGWFGGGRLGSGGAGVSLLDRIDYSNDLTTASVRSPLNISRYSLAATGNSDYGWFGGGISPAILTPEYPTGVLSIVERINYSNDSTTASTRGALSANRAALTATSGVLNIRRQKTGSYGWFAGGAWSGPTYSTVDRIDFSNDLTLTSQRSILTSARYLFAATGTSDYGWFGGDATATIDRIDFSNDSSNALPRTSLSASRFGLAATGNSNYGWFGGGAITNKVDRINYSNDLSSISPRGVLSSAKYNLTATGNSNYGWFGGGASPSSTPKIISTVDRINFSNDSVTVSVRGSLSSTRQQLTATGNSNYGWFGGGSLPTSTPRTVATVDRIDFSNDLSSISVRGPLSAARSYLAATGNSNYGWFSCGSPSSSPTTDRIDRINFSNDLSTASIRGTSRISTFGQAATSNTPIG